MSAKLLYTLTDENPGLHKQIGCMNGFFQIFDRHHLLSGRRVKCPKMLPPIPGQSSNHGVEHSSASEKATETSVKKVTKEKQRVSTTESSRTSFSSSSCSSSFSSLECNRVTQLEPTSYGQNKFSENTSRECLMNQPNTPVRSKTQHPDLRDIVKDSVYREARGLPVATVTKEEVQGHMFKHIDSPRPSQLPKSVKHRHSGLSEPFQSAATPRQATWNSKEERDRSRLLTTRDPPRDGSRLLNRDAPRFSFDGRESRDTFKSLRIKELPRLSLDSRQSTIRATTSEMKSSYFVQDLHMESRNSSKTPNSQQELASHKRSSSVVAKLMGLEAFPGDPSTNENQTRLTKTCTVKNQSSSRSLDENKNHMLRFQQNSHKNSISPRMRNADSVTKSTSSSKFPVEPAPWKQIDGRQGSQVSVHKHQDVNMKSPNSASVYGEIEKRLADIEFKKSGKDLRALKRILEAMQKTKEMSETEQDNQALNLESQTGHNSSLDQSFKLSNQRILQRSNSAVIKGNRSPRCSRSPIVIMKPGALIEIGNNTALLMTSTDSISGEHKFQTCTDSRKGSVDRHPTKDITQRGSTFRDPSSCSIHSTDINTRVRTPRSMQTLRVARQVTGESTTSSGTVSPSLQQKKNGLQKQSCTSTTSSPDSSRTRRQLGRQPIEPGSPGRKLKPKYANSHQNNNQFKKTSSNTSDLRNHGNAISQQSESSTSSASHIETDTTSTNGSDPNNSTFFQYYSLKQKNLEVKFLTDRAVAEPAVVTSEQPSPISVLDATFYRDESPSPVKKITNTFRDDEVLNSDEVEWAVDLDHQLPTKTPNLSSESDHNKSENIQHLVSSFEQDESILNYITVLCEDSNQDHRYISKILLASGLLRNLDSVMTSIPFHPSGHPINPNTFLAVEHTMTSKTLSDDENMSRNTSHQKAVEKTQRKLIFDVVNEILGHKLVSEGNSKQWFSPNKLAGGRLTGQQLLRELFSEIDQLQANKPSCSSEDEDDTLTSISWGDLMHQSTNWSSKGEISGLVLDIERSIFKDLISEVVNGETASLQTRSGGYCRQLFSK